MVDESVELFEVRPAGQGAHRRARDIMIRYHDQSFSYVDPVVFTVVDADPALERILTVDGRDFSLYRFAHDVEVVVPLKHSFGEPHEPDSTESPRLLELATSGLTGPRWTIS